MPIGCEGALFFSDLSSSCKSLCKSDWEPYRNKRSDSVYKGWTKYFNSIDTPSGTGDHEHYFFYYGENKRDRSAVYASNGSTFKGCNKTAIDVRERKTHKPWWALSKNYTLLFSEFTDLNLTKSQFSKNQSHPEYQYRLKPDYG